MRRLTLVLLLVAGLTAAASCSGDDNATSTAGPCGVAETVVCGGPTIVPSTGTAGSQGSLLFPSETRDGSTLGKSNAPVAIELWVSLRCPHCHDFVYEALPQIVTTYVDTGKIKLTIRNAALGDAAIEAHSALDCAKDQGEFWEAFDAMYYNYTENDADYTRDKINDRLAGSGVDLTALDACLDAGTHTADVTNDVNELKATNFNLLPVLKDGSDIRDSLESFADAKTFIDAHLSQ